MRLLPYRVCLQTIYSCGLRLKEGTHLQVADLDPQRHLIHIHHAKGGKDRYVPLPESTLEALRQYWKTHRNPVWIFPASGRSRTHYSTATQPMPHGNVQEAFRSSLRASGIRKPASVHTLRHYAESRTMSSGDLNSRQIKPFPLANSA